ncbi:family S53 protease [Exidia glandulosa HHB12029]|uniref:Family S53 protease n=1 Tax=Exidia glandulosa HHB12029 TaxID=1314781 RepID=A0A165MLY7_EXIGL|nr:family S53 protease [Exidia glandulosa HHB12029]
MVFRSLVLFALLAAVAAAPAQRQKAVHERKILPSSFSRVGAANSTQALTMRLGLKNKDTAGLIDALMRVSDPASEFFGQHLSQAEVNAFLGPTPETKSAVNAWLAENGIKTKTVSPAGDWIEFTLPVKQANELFDADFTVFKHNADGSEAVRTLQYSLPVDLQDKIAVLSPGVSFGAMSKGPKVKRQLGKVSLAKRQSVPAGCDTTITPACLQALYGIPTTRATQATNVLGVAGFINQWASHSDLSQFLNSLRPDAANGTFTVQTLDGGVNVDLPGGILAGIEADLDIQYTVGVATAVKNVFISAGTFNNDDLSGFLDMINFLLGQSAPPQVLTTSYGANEADVSPAMAQYVALSKQLCTAYTALGARGTSILFASGDGGVSGSQSQTCTTFQPTFPAGCPFITMVGATTGVPETSATFSSGGFSNIFSRASFQDAAVSAYLASINDTNAGLFNPNGRAFPDVAAMGDNVEVVNSALAELVAGTSCSSPIFASIISLINDRRIAAGKSSLGFLNPFLYANPQAFNDITTGSNPGCGTNGFPAKAGWDPVTGLGTPKFSALLSAAMALP